MRLLFISLMVATLASLATFFKGSILTKTSTLVRPLATFAGRHFQSDQLKARSSDSSAVGKTSDMAEPVPADPNPLSILSEAAPADQPTVEKELPKLSTSDFRTYNKLAVMMDAYHNHFRHTWNMLYKACENNKRPPGMSMRGFIGTALQLCHHLTAHHTIEEQFIFPKLATRMPVFQESEILLQQHEQIHEGLEKIEAYLEKCLSGEKELEMGVLKEIMDTFGTVLWTHLDEEVRTLGAENMRKYWSKEEIMAMNW